MRQNVETANMDMNVIIGIAEEIPRKDGWFTNVVGVLLLRIAVEDLVLEMVMHK